ncbi:MAG: gliding motility-associated C-terminal domain-containing protein [Bacteroidaceae bacterium]|nr:gliding motility-associated C-terminal domain-containing protein [Bacteroidaceae bacterium]
MKLTIHNFTFAIFLLVALFTSQSTQAQRISVEGGDGLSYTYLEDYKATDGINVVLVVYGTADKVLRYDGRSTEPITWYTYEDVLTPLPSTQDGIHSTIPLTRTECGYVIMQGNKTYYVYVVDYIKHPLILSSITTDENNSCDIVTLNITGEGNEMYYYAFNNKLPHEIHRDIDIMYNTLQWNDELLQYEEIQQVVSLRQFSSTYPVAAPLCNTTFTVSGDRFLQAWNMPQEVSSDEFATYAVEAQAKATQTYREEANEIDRQPTSGLGGSAPVEIEFCAYYTDAVTHAEWQFSQDGNFSGITHRYNDDLLRYTFNEEGTTYVRLVVTSLNETCVYECEPLVINVGTSSLEIPNAFSPGTIDGKNDEWRVAFKSIVEFRCWIFNKQGVQMYYSENPGAGWDGTHAGRLASPGVYYYVIEARGADDVEYKRSGHINLMRSKKNSTTNDNNIE